MEKLQGIQPENYRFIIGVGLLLMAAMLMGFDNGSGGELTASYGKEVDVYSGITFEGSASYTAPSDDVTSGTGQVSGSLEKEWSGPDRNYSASITGGTQVYPSEPGNTFANGSVIVENPRTGRSLAFEMKKGSYAGLRFEQDF